MDESYGWVITWANPEVFDPEDHEVGVMGPGGIPADLEALLNRDRNVPGRTFAFRMFDDDGIHYYNGRLALPEGVTPWSAYEEAAFGPLQDYGAPNAGATELQYRNASGKWETI